MSSAMVRGVGRDARRIAALAGQRAREVSEANEL
jgi:hypothetical protein